MPLSGNCPVCDASIIPLEEVEECEILSCPDCKSSLVVECIKNSNLVLEQAPQMEEDWGE